MPTLVVRVFDPVRGVTKGGEELLEGPGTKWLDVEAPDEALLNRLGERYGLHRLAIEDCLHLDQRPKLEDYPGHQFLVTQGFCRVLDAEGRHDPANIELHEMHVFLGADWLITVHDKAHPSVNKAIDRVTRDPNDTIGRGVDFVAYLIIDAMVDENFPLLDTFNDELEDLETAIFEGPSRDHLKRTFALKRALVQVRRVLSPQRDVVGLLSKRGMPNVSERTALYFRDVYDHLVRLYEQIDACRDLLGNAMDGYLSVQANRTGDVTKQLAIISTIFLPLAFIVGFFGQNFEELSTPPFFHAMLVSMAVIPVAMVWWFLHKKWL
ncbi:MAG: magnesium transporter CorA family protein [Myxococcaceae bacterium]|nr:magnesium transporter CorA family protein [Myxococcaceae bacterium]